MRNTIITRLVCNECGILLDVCYYNEASETAKRADHWRKDDPTGALCFYNKLYVSPCQNCISKQTKSAKQLTDAIKALTNESTDTPTS